MCSARKSTPTAEFAQEMPVLNVSKDLASMLTKHCACLVPISMIIAGHAPNKIVTNVLMVLAWMEIHASPAQLSMITVTNVLSANVLSVSLALVSTQIKLHALGVLTST